MADILDVTQEPGGALLVRGEADLSTRSVLADALARCVSDTIVVDLSACTFLDSSALAVLIRAAHEAERSGRSLVIRRPSRATRRVLELAGSHLTVHD